VPTPTPNPAPTPATPAPPASGDQGSPQHGSGDSGTPSKPSQDQQPPKADKPLPPPVAINLTPDAATSYDPDALPTGSIGDPTLALDGQALTAWTLQLPTTGAGTAVRPPSAGVLIDLGKARDVRRLDVLTPTPGISIDVYGTTARKAPARLKDAGWDLLATQLDVGKRQKIPLGDGTKSYRQILVWIADGPGDGTSTVSLSELQLLG
jgi:hypothetical protein